jgi:putative flippase GtrA
VDNLTNKIKLILANEKCVQIIKFTAVGILNTLIDISVAFALKGFFGIYYIICQIVGYTSGTLNSFFLNKFFTFKRNGAGQNSLLQFTRFIAINLVSLGATLVILKLLIDVLLINFYISKVIVTILSLSINFIGSKFWVFKKVDVKHG